MKTFFSSLVGGAILAVVATTAASAFTTWDTFEYNGYSVKARYADGELRYIKAKNETTGDKFSGRVSVGGIAVIDTVDGKRRFDINVLEARLKSRTELRDLAQVAN
ncbi:MAG: hypothetical protein AAF607_12765 [Pseudomonadota bacterium]